ncbi:MAG: ParA family protein [Rickettsiales bacterium]|nr:MAG: ParA family protein [Rickettsiales bacterium]
MPKHDKKAKLILIGNQKGGIGKSITTMLLATALGSDYKKNVLIIECDAQRSISKIRSYEKNSFPDAHPPCDIIYVQISKLDSTVEENQYNYDLIFIDMPRITADLDNDENGDKQQEEVLSLIMLAEIILIPLTAFEIDLHSSEDFFELLEILKEYKIANKLPITIYAFQNRAKGTKEDTLLRAWAGEHNIAMFDTVIKDSIHIQRAVSTFIPITSSPINPSNKTVINNYKEFIKEFIVKLNIK